MKYPIFHFIYEIPSLPLASRLEIFVILGIMNIPRIVKRKRYSFDRFVFYRDDRKWIYLDD